MEAKVKSTICLAMIVKNESHVIARCLKSIKPIIDYWVIVDTGSKDDTVSIIQEILKDTPGAIYKKSWVNFAYNRNQALEYAENKADYILMLDADEEIIVKGEINFCLTHPTYQIEIVNENNKFFRLPLFKNNQGWRYKGAIHEFINIPENTPAKILENICIITHADGYRSLDKNKLQHDIAVLHAALNDEPNNAHYLFYLGRYYLMVNNLEKAHKYLLQCKNTIKTNKRISIKKYPIMEFECWYAQLLLAEVKKKLSFSHHKIQAQYLETFSDNNWHYAPLYLLAKTYQEKNFFYTAYIFLRAIIDMPPSEPIAYLHKDVFYFIRFAFIECTFNIKRYEECLRINSQLVQDVNCPEYFKNIAIRNQDVIISAIRAR